MTWYIIIFAVLITLFFLMVTLSGILQIGSIRLSTRASVVFVLITIASFINCIFLYKQTTFNTGQSPIKYEQTLNINTQNGDYYYINAQDYKVDTSNVSITQKNKQDLKYNIYTIYFKAVDDHQISNQANNQ